MLRTFSLFAVAAVCLLLPAKLNAGGPPWLCLPIDGVTPDNVKACADLLTTKLEHKLWPSNRTIQIQKHAGQWYVAFSMEGHVGLSDVQTALQGSGFSVPRDRLRLFGHVTLEIEPRAAPRKELLADLNALKHVSVAESQVKEDRFLVTVDMPYPERFYDSDQKIAIGWDTYQRNDDFNSNQSTMPRIPVTAEQLPTYNAFRDVVAKHKASLKDIRWSDTYRMRPLGGVAVRDQAAVTSPEAALPVGKWKVEFTNGVNQVCDIFEFDGGHATVDEPLRRSRGTVVVKDGSVVLTFNDDRVERWTAVGKRFIVEHWFPSSRYPAETPVLGIADRAP